MIDVGSSPEDKLLRAMVRIRMVEEAIAERYHEQKMRCPVHLSVGQEAPSAAFSIVADSEDFAVSSHRAHAHFLAKGGSIESLVAELYGKVSGCSKGAGGSMHLADVSKGFMGSSAIVGNSIPVGVGLALSQKMRGESRVTWIFLGDAATEEGVYYESVNFAVLKKLPVIFMCENNDYSVYSDSSVRRPSAQTISQVANALGAQSKRVDGNDALRSLEAVKWAREKIQHGPVLLEFKTFRQREHCGPNFDDSLGYRPVAYVARGMASDPIPRLIKDLGQNEELSWLDSYRREVEKEIANAFRMAEEADFLTLDVASGLVYA